MNDVLNLAKTGVESCEDGVYAGLTKVLMVNIDMGLTYLYEIFAWDN